MRLEDHHRLLEEIARLDKDLENPALDQAARADGQKKHDAKAEEIHTQEKENRELRVTRDHNLQELTVRLRNQITEDILRVVRARVETDHYDLVMNKSGRGAQGKLLVLYGNPNMDISDGVLATLNEGRAVSPSPTPAASPEP